MKKIIKILSLVSLVTLGFRTQAEFKNPVVFGFALAGTTLAAHKLINRAMKEDKVKSNDKKPKIKQVINYMQSKWAIPGLCMATIAASQVVDKPFSLLNKEILPTAGLVLGALGAGIYFSKSTKTKPTQRYDNRFYYNKEAYKTIPVAMTYTTIAGISAYQLSQVSHK